MPDNLAITVYPKIQNSGFLDAIPSPSTCPCRSVSEWVSGWMFSDFGDSYCIYRSCEHVLKSSYKLWSELQGVLRLASLYNFHPIRAPMSVYFGTFSIWNLYKIPEFLFHLAWHWIGFTLTELAKSPVWNSFSWQFPCEFEQFHAFSFLFHNKNH